MHPSGLAATHPAAPLLSEWATFGCPTMTGAPWSITQMEAPIARGPHKAVLMEQAVAHFADEVMEKVSAEKHDSYIGTT